MPNSVVSKALTRPDLPLCLWIACRQVRPIDLKLNVGVTRFSGFRLRIVDKPGDSDDYRVGNRRPGSIVLSDHHNSLTVVKLRDSIQAMVD